MPGIGRRAENGNPHPLPLFIHEVAFERTEAMRNVFAAPEHLDDIASKARYTGYIPWNHLAYILAQDKRYIDVLINLWDEYRRANAGSTVTGRAELSDYGGRITIWLMLLAHWSGTNDTEYPLLKIYSLDSDTGEYLLSRQTELPFAKLSELGKLFSDYLKIHPPTLLFSTQDGPREGKPDIPDLNITDKNSFVKKGNFWTIRHGDKEAIIKNLDGIHYIALLLDRPGKSVSCRELHLAVSGRMPEKNMSEGAAIDEGLNIGGSRQSVIDKKAKSEYLAQYRSLQNDLESADSEIERQEIEREMEIILQNLKEQAFPDKGMKKVQSNIINRLRDAYKALAKVSMKALAKHLEDHIKPDKAYGLCYSGAISWKIVR